MNKIAFVLLVSSLFFTACNKNFKVGADYKDVTVVYALLSKSDTFNYIKITKGYFDEDVYFNSPCHYLPNLGDEWTLNRLRGSSHIHILTGSGDYEDPEGSRRLSNILSSKGIPHELDIWGPDMRHDWPTWRAMLPYYIDSRF